jgi:hypothetical protein
MTIKAKSVQSVEETISPNISFKKFNLTNNITGWVVFLVASATYLLTIEPTASFWDCGEFITSSYKMEVGHPPGAPFFMLMAKFFSLFASDKSHVAMMINSFSALASGFTILFLFWTITHIARNIIGRDKSLSTDNLIAIMGAGAVGALAYTFSDTFWFSAVEGEVYGFSSFFTAIVFWAILKWENVADEKYANRWLILIAYLMGLSIGVHLLNLLAIPAIVFVFYFKKYETSRMGILLASLASIGILGAVMYFIIPGAVIFASNFELLFTNVFGLPFNTGTYIYVLLLFVGLGLGIYYTRKESKLFIYIFSGVLFVLLFFSSLALVLWLLLFGGFAVFVYSTNKNAHIIFNNVLTIITVILIGYSSFALTMIRSSAGTPMNQNQPDNVFNLLSYLNRDQYGDRPLFFGQYFNAQPTQSEEGDPIYVQRDGKYVVADHKIEYKYDSKDEIIFPRMYSSSQSPDHPKGYIEWAGLNEGDLYNQVQNPKTGQLMVDQNGSPVYDRQSPKDPPSFGNNLKFFFKYQIGFMYLRYFMWNFAGRQNDIQGEGDIINGNWICGIKFIDDWRLGPQDQLPQDLQKNKGKNKYFFLPLIFGLLGMFYMFSRNKRGKQSFWVIMLFFIFTGLAIVVYLNQPPYQPRERDYAYAGSFYAFAIWVGFGVLMIYDWLKKLAPSALSAIFVSIFGILTVPVIMANQNWDDHNRSGRYTVIDFASNYLNSCKPNAILFTNGDNDTFPLWYAQEVEGVRTDVRVINLSYLSTHWYIMQHERQAYKAAPAPFGFKLDQIEPGKRDIIFVQDLIKERSSLKKYIDFILSDASGTVIQSGDGASQYFFPGRHVWLAADSTEILSKGVVEPEDDSLIVPKLEWDIKSNINNYINKNQFAVLALLANNKWDRPIYFATTVGYDGYFNLQDYFQLEGMAYRLVPISTKGDPFELGHINTKIMYDNLMNKFKWGGIEKEAVYLDENNTRMLMGMKNNFSRLAAQLIREGKKDSAITVLDRCEQLMPNKRVPYNYFNIFLAEDYYKAGQKEKADKMIEAIADKTIENLRYILSLPTKYRNRTGNEGDQNIAIARQILQTLGQNKQEDMLKKIGEKFEAVMKLQ